MDFILEDYQRYFNRLNDLFSPLLYSFLGLVSSIVLLWHNLDHMADQFQTTFNDNSPQRFDYIVVGGGSSGAVIANRLAKQYHVLLLEAGGEPNPLTYVPALSWLLINQQYIDWQFKTAPQENSCLAMKNQECAWSHGKGLGGSTNLNSMMYTRGHQKDYDNWVKITGHKRWGFDNVMQYFQKTEKYIESSKSDYHGDEGELRVAYPGYKGMADFFLRAATDTGYNIIDFNGPYSEGFNKIPNVQTEKGRRLGTCQAFIQPEIDNPNLTIFKYAEAVKVQFRENNDAFAVSFFKNGVPKIVFARNEIILSAGAIGNAKILLLSGIGPRNHLDYLNISMIADLPVGKNLQGHVGTFVGPFIVNDTVTMNADRDVNTATIHEFVTNGTGPLTSTGLEAAGYLMSSIAKREGNNSWPDLELLFFGNAVNENMPRDFSKAFNVRDGVLEKFLAPAKDEDSFQILTLLGRPKSRGRVRLQSSNPIDPAFIDPNFYSHPEDMQSLIEGVKKAVEIVEKSKTLQGLDASLMEKSFPGCEKTKFRSDDYWECYIRHYTVVMHAAVGTCAMGSADSKLAVVDPKLRVIGTKNLRVIDASVMPNIISGSTHAVSVMIAEIGTELLLENSNNKLR